jgi:hypothetical protein
LILYVNHLLNFSLSYSAPLTADKRVSAESGYKTDEFVVGGLTRMHEKKMYLEEVEYKQAVDETAVLK